MKRFINISIFVILPLVMGGLIYIISRPKTLKMFEWFDQINLSKEVELIRSKFSNIEFPNWMIYNLPDLLWVFSFTSLILIIWNKKIYKENILYVIFPMTVGILSELGQLISTINGTFDKMDIIFYIGGGLLSLSLITTIKTIKYEKKLLHLTSILTIFTFIFIAFGSNDDSDSSEPENSKMLAYSYAEDFVKQRLKSPSTAEFPGLFEKADHITELGNDEYLINSWVDSQNGFGAMLRSEFSCKIIFKDEKVRVENLIIE